jgi:hypothetical protein
VVDPKNPIVGSLPGCCVRAASGHAAAPPSRVMKSRCGHVDIRLTLVEIALD